ncbi:F0F1 ATP synthase subunit A [Methanocrinis sp.]|uniref:F0F1 ATP synthase subunit A n=1 Tax=Methanocrinis sp. TaxID=3101522 RepID=UPI003D0B3A8F
MVELSPDQAVLWRWEFVTINETILFTWLVIGIMVFMAWAATRDLSTTPPFSRRQVALETIISYMRNEIREIARRDSDPYLPFSGTLFLFLSLSSILGVVPGYRSPTSSLSTTAALAACVFFAVPIYGILQQGVSDYFRRYIQPTPLMLPFNVIGEISRTVALALRLFGNMMSQTLLVAVLISLAPLFLPVIMDLFGLLIGQVQAYIFAVLATVYIVSASSDEGAGEGEIEEEETEGEMKQEPEGGT